MKIDDYIVFCQKSMEWCGQESERASALIMKVIDCLVEDTKRVSAMSDEALIALQKIKSDASDASDEGEIQQHQKVKNLAGALDSLRNQHQGVGKLVDPIIQSLQFQDRVSQNMQNLSRMMLIWKENRSADLDLDAFGRLFLEVTTMSSERDIVRSLIAGLPEDDETSTNVLLF